MKLDKIKLVKPAQQHKQAVLEYREEFLDAHETIHGSNELDHLASFEEWLRLCVDGENEVTVPEGRVPASEYLAIRSTDGKLVGMVSIRHRLNDYLKSEGGHIGYSVRKSERRKGYATQILKEALGVCKELGISRVLVTCEPDNFGSAGVIKANGGVYEKRVAKEDGGQLDHYWIATTTRTDA